VKHEEGVAKTSDNMPVGTAVALVDVSDCDESENAVVTCVVTGDIPFILCLVCENSNDLKMKYFLRYTTGI